MKKLTRTDVAYRLAVPAHFFKCLLLPRFKGKNFLDLKVKYKNLKLEFRCTKRKTEEDQDAGTEFKIQVQKKIKLLGKDIWTDVF
ncbi:hypothetical protein GH714_005058 [Hevea brasiliensis]|uniref:Uncharacterized protein n=1 Tax=Hevea brasiliensis TaxID=3981 RepID=A0A6A6KZ63_HEVBR|nr:hypothetical protein GH714_005058 [Hevea brasiliensis]